MQKDNKGEWLGKQLTEIMRRHSAEPDFARLLEKDPNKALESFDFTPEQINHFQIIDSSDECSCGVINSSCEGVGCPGSTTGVRHPVN